MLEFFRGWRRKAGCVLLGFAMAAWCVWVRSPIELIHLRMTILDRKFDLASLRGELVFSSWAAQGEEDWDWGRKYIPPSLYPDRRLSDTANPDVVHHSYFILQYWLLILITSLLSACLLLWKPRKRETHRISEDNSN